MKKLIFIIVILASNLSSAQTKQETLDWLNLKLLEYTDSFMGEFSINVENDPSWGEIIVIKSRVSNEYMSEHYQIYTFLPKNISAVITTSKFRTDGQLGIQIISKKSNIYYNGNEFVSSVDIFCDSGSDEAIMRMQKGIIHLLNLMGNPLTTPKELFKN